MEAGAGQATGATELYDLRDRSRASATNVAERNPEVVATLGRGARPLAGEQHQGGAPAGAPVELTSEEWRELESLGYVR